MIVVAVCAGDVEQAFAVALPDAFDGGSVADEIDEFFGPDRQVGIEKALHASVGNEMIFSEAIDRDISMVEMNVPDEGEER